MLIKPNPIKLTPAFRSLIPYFGGKSKLAHLYSAPVYDTIIEPFAGGASYSLLHAAKDKTKKVILNDLNGPTVAVWRFLTSPNALDIIRTRLPKDVKEGTPVEEITKPDDCEGYIWLVRANAAQGAFGMAGIRHKVSPFGAKAWSSNDDGSGGLRGKLEYWIPIIKDWTITMQDYALIPNQEATWYIDPPYNNAAGATYAKGSKDIDFEKLAEWCKTRKGQVIVAENAGATWLPFTTLTDRRQGIYCATVKSEVGEVVWEKNDGGDVGLW